MFAYDYDEIAGIVGKNEDNCRQLATRARRRIEEQKPPVEASREQLERLADRFFAAVRDGNVDALVELLAADVIVYGDSGGKAPSWPRPIVGRDRVSRLFAGWGRQFDDLGASIQLHEVNGQPGAVLLDSEQRVINVVSLDIADGVVQTIRSVVNPEKLGHLGPLGDIRALLRGRRGEPHG